MKLRKQAAAVTRTKIVSVGTKLDRNEGKHLRKFLQHTLADSESICFDASNLARADAGGLAELFAIVAEVLNRGGEAIVWGASASMRALFELVQLDRVVEMRDRNDPVYSMLLGAAPRGELADFAGQLAQAGA